MSSGLFKKIVVFDDETNFQKQRVLESELVDAYSKGIMRHRLSKHK